MRLNITEINQGKGKFYLGKMKFSELKKIARFHIRTVKGEGINRTTDETKIKQIAKYISDEAGGVLPLFATPLVISLELDDGVSIDGNTIIIPENVPEIAMIIDGQHRFKGTELYFLHGENPIDIDFSIVFLIDFSDFQLSEIFANINFKQKPVSRSLYYDIFGSLPPEDGKFSDLQLAHMLTCFLNENELSPIKGIIKMLGNGKGLISQSFMVDAFVKFFRNKEVWWTYLELQDKNSIEIFLKEYFLFIKNKFSEFNYSINDKGDFETNGHILWKTTGFGAILYLIQDIFMDSRFDINGNIEEYLSHIFNNKDKLSDKDIKNFFSKDGANAGSGGLQSKLYRELSKKIFYNSGKDILKKAIFKDYNTGDYFNLGDMYFRYKDKLQNEFSNSSTIEAKIRRLLQILRDEKFLEFLGKGNYKLIKKD